MNRVVEQVEVLLGISEKNDETLTALAIRSGGKELEASVSNAIQRLKASEVPENDRASRPDLLQMEDYPEKLSSCLLFILL